MAGFSSREDLGNAGGIVGRVWNWELVKENGCKELDTIKWLSTQAHMQGKYNSEIISSLLPPPVRGKS